MYALYVLLIFLFLKVLNWRIHRAFGKDPEPEEEEEEEEEEGRGEGEGQPASVTGAHGDGSAVVGAPAVNGGQQHADVDVHPQPASGSSVVASLDSPAAGTGEAGVQGPDLNSKVCTSHFV